MRASYKAADSIADNNVWYTPFADITFDTYFAPFTLEHGSAFINHYRHRYCSGKPPSAEDVAALHSLQQTIDGLLKHVDDRGAFIRLNTRSPKDAIALDRERFLNKTQECTLNEKLQLFFDLTMTSLCVHTGKEAVDLLLSSERIFVDVIQAFDANEIHSNHSQGAMAETSIEVNATAHVSSSNTESVTGCGHNWDLEICVRQWENHLREDLEFRVFVSNYELIGASQYNTNVSYPNVLANKDLIQHKLGDFFISEVQSRLRTIKMPDAVVDIALVPISDSFSTPQRERSYSPRLPFTSNSLALARVVVIELNPYNKRTGAGLFKWIGERTLEATTPQIKGGGDMKCNFDFRLVVPVPLAGSCTTKCEIVSNTTASIGDVERSRIGGGCVENKDVDQKALLLEMLLAEADEACKRKQREAQRQHNEEEGASKCREREAKDTRQCAIC